MSEFFLSNSSSQPGAPVPAQARLPLQDTYPLQEDVSLSELAHCSKRVLHNAHDRAIALGGDNHAWHHGKLLDLSPSLKRLWKVQIHLIPIEVSIVRSGHTAVTERSQSWEDA